MRSEEHLASAERAVRMRIRRQEEALVESRSVLEGILETRRQMDIERQPNPPRKEKP